MSEKKAKISDIVKSCLAGFLDENGLELYHVDFKKEGKDWYLNVYIDIKEDAAKPDAALADAEADSANAESDSANADAALDPRYVSTDDCEKVSNYLSERLDELDPIEQNYILMVSSPGMDRELFEQKDFDRFTGELVDVKLYRPKDGSKEFQGKLIGLEGDTITIEDEDGNKRSFAKKDVAKTCLSVVF